MKLICAANAYLSFPGQPHGPVGVLVDGGDIRAVGRPDQFGAEIERVELGDVYLMPGLIDGHVHLAFDGGPDPVAFVQHSDEDALVAQMHFAAASLRDAGITTARDLGAPGLLDIGVRASIRAGTRPGPELLLACRPLTTPGGHCWFFGGECPDPAAMLDAVRLHADLGADWIKVVVSGGFLTDGTIPAEPQFDHDSLAAVVALAHQRGLRVAAHAHSTAAIALSARAGVDTIEHATFLAPGGVDFDPEIRRMLIDNGVAVCPTANADSFTYPPDSGRDALARLVEMHGDGLTLLMGTDAGVRNILPGQYVEGLQSLRAAGLAPEAILEAATSGAARTLGIAAQVGQIEPGLRADLVACDGDPVRDLATIGRPTWVMSAGQVHRPVPLGIKQPALGNGQPA